jgi:hypothetical protein
MNKLQLKRLSAASSLFVLICFLQGCATQKTLIPTGGSRADGTVKLSYEYGLFEKPQIDPAQGEIAAKQRCSLWVVTNGLPLLNTSALALVDQIN